MSLTSTSNRNCNAAAPAVVGHLVVTAGARARVLPARPLRLVQQRQRTVTRTVTQEDEVDVRSTQCLPIAKQIVLRWCFALRHEELSVLPSGRCGGHTWSWRLQEVDLDQSVDVVKRKLIDAAGAGKSFTSPGWLTQLGRLWGGKSVYLVCCLSTLQAILFQYPYLQ